jgi:prevent-host-death family protein
MGLTTNSGFAIIPILGNLDTNIGGTMSTKTVTSTEVQNNFGQIIDAVAQEHTRYIIKRRNVPQVIIMSLSDFRQLLSNPTEREKIDGIIRELTPVYQLGESVDIPDE